MSLRWLTEPLTDLPSRAARQVGDYISPANQTGSPIRGFASGAVQGAGDLLSDMTSPLSLAGSAMGLGAAKGAWRGGKAIARAAKGVGPSRPIIKDMMSADEVADMYRRYRNPAANAAESMGPRATNVPNNPVARQLETERMAAYNPSEGIPAPSGQDLQQLLVNQSRAGRPMMNPQVINEAPVQQIMHPGQAEVNNMLQQLVGNLRRAPTGISPRPEAQEAIVRQLMMRGGR